MSEKQSLEVICPMCADAAQKVESVIEERGYGEVFAAILIGRIFHHLHKDGTRKQCRQTLPQEWVFTLGTIEEVDQFRRVVASLLAKSKGNTRILQFLM